MSMRFRDSDESFLSLAGAYISYSICLPKMSLADIVEVVVFM
jgi:hypothetical protein